VTVPDPYPSGDTSATPALTALLRDRIAREGPLPFPEFMATALYEPTLGYYARETRQVGRGGDFFTSVSVGPLFGQLLARRFLTWWQEAGQPTRWRLTECGAHDGTFAGDILTALQALSPPAFAALEYRIIEPLPLLAEAQAANLAAFGETVDILPSPAALTHDPLPGIVFGNELLDALPFHLVEWHNGAWAELHVENAPHKVSVSGSSLSNFKFQISNSSAPLSPELSAALNRLPIPNGPYRTEVRTNFSSFLAPLLAAITHGRMIWPDYGFARPEYYLPERNTGTLRTFQRHRAGEDPLDSPGERDITAHVDFTAVAEAAINLGATPAEFAGQGSWLTRLAEPWLRESEAALTPAQIRQFQTLVHPGHLGAKFHILELAWNEAVDPEQAAQALRRLALE
jgi:SAM-dependent MidA family methyltransferase